MNLKMSAAQLRLWADPEVRATRLAVFRSEDYRRRLTERNRAMWLDPATRPRLVAGQSKRAMKKGGHPANFVEFTPDMDRALTDGYRDGAALRAIAARIGVDIRTLMRRVGELGLPRRRG